MTTYVAFLRGINVGGNNKIPMAQLRSALESAGFGNVRTYIQSGNVLVDTSRARPSTVARRIQDVIADEFGLSIPTIAVDTSALAAIVEANPYASEEDPRRVHVFFLPSPLDAGSIAELGALRDAAHAKGGREQLTVIDEVMYLHTPDGFGTSDLAKALSTRGKAAFRSGTARNWATVSKLLDMARAGK